MSVDTNIEDLEIDYIEVRLVTGEFPKGGMVSLRNIETGNDVVSIADTDSLAGNKAYGC